MSGKAVVVTDSVASIPRELVEEYGIAVVPIQVVFGDKAYRDGIDITPAKFYAMLKQAPKLPTTAGALPGSFLEVYQEASRRATTLLCITVSAKLSGMFNAARQAKEMAKEALPEVTIELFDSGTAAIAEGLVALAAARQAALGKSLSEVVETAERIKQRVTLLVMLDTLYYLVKGGRAPRVAALATSLLQIKPILTIIDGEVHLLTNSRTTAGAIQRLVELMKQKVVGGRSLHVAVTHAEALDKAVVLRDEIASRFDCAELYITEFTPVMGAHTGPGVIGLAFYCGD